MISNKSSNSVDLDTAHRFRSQENPLKFNCRQDNLGTDFSKLK